MRILELYLKAYGPFTEKRIALDSEAPGLHVVFGGNEAGKSSALRALRDLLYGIPGQTPDDFLHQYARLRIGARIEDPEAGELSFLRKKGNKNTLRSFDDARALPDTALDPFLRGVPGDLFSRLFGIDHAELATGSRTLLEEDGDLAQALFSAGLGSVNLRGVLAGLANQADELFRPRGANQPINAAIHEYRDLMRGVREASLQGRDWWEQDRARGAATSELEEIARELEEQRTLQTRLQRIRSALAPLERRRSLRAELEALGPVQPLPQEFEARLHAALEQQRESRSLEARSLEEQRAASERLAGLQVDVAIVGQREPIEQLGQELGAYRNAQRDLPRRESERYQLAAELTRQLAALRVDLPNDRLDELRAPLGRRSEIQDLIDEHTRLETRIETVTRTLEDEREALSAARAQRDALPSPRDAEPLRRALQAARRLGDIDSRLMEARRVCDEEARDSESRLSAMGLWTGTLERLERLPVPQPESVERFERGFADLAGRRDRLQTALEQATTEVREHDSRLEALRRVGAAPTEAAVEAERDRRDAGWRLIRRRWIEGEPIDDEIERFSSGAPLPQLYEESVRAADDVADRLRREADRVAQQAELEARREQAAEALAAAGQKLERLGDEEQALRAEWEELWAQAGIAPLTPREMRAWLHRQLALREAGVALRRKRDELEALNAERAHAREAVLAALRALDPEAAAGGDALAPLLDRAQEQIEDLDQVESTRSRIDEAIEGSEVTSRRAAEQQRSGEQRREDWAREWTAAVAGLGLAHGERPAAALDRLEQAARLLERRREIEGLDARITGIQRDMARTEDAVRRFIADHASELAELTLEEQVLQLGRSLAEAEREETLRAEITEQLAAANERRGQAARALAEAERELEALRRAAGCAEDAELEPALRRWQHHQQLSSDVADLELQLTDIGAGASIGELEAETREADRDALPGRIDACGMRVDELERRRSEAHAAQAAAEAELRRMDGSAAAAEAASRAEEKATKLRRHVEGYVKLRLAHAILQHEIERYRSAHQSPVLERASKLFAGLTMGSFGGLQSDYDDERPIVVGVRPDESRLEVHEMSSGTRDQLYLALRLATLEEWVDRSGPMPFVLDDILVNFDDDRARPALEVLARLGARTQVLLFTHLGRDRDHARELGIPVVDLEES